MKVELTKEQLELFNQGTKISTSDKDYYYFPYWLEIDKESKEQSLHMLDSLPIELKNKVEETLAEYIAFYKDNPTSFTTHAILTDNCFKK